MQRVSIWGAGRLAESLLIGLAGAGWPGEVWIHGRDPARTEALAARFGSPAVRAVATSDDLITDGAIVLLMTPLGAIAALPEALVARARACGALLVSCGNGLTLAQLAARYPGVALGKMVPNVLWRGGRGLSLLAWQAGVPEAQRRRLRAILSTVSRVHEVDDERDLPRLARVTSAGPGLWAALVEALGAAFGDDEDARGLLLASLASTIDELRTSGRAPAELVAEVATHPGGPTYTGVEMIRGEIAPRLVEMAARMAAIYEARERALAAG
jgi:pyrroline-5-carboxylate reductase